MDDAFVRCGSWPTCGQSFGETWYVLVEDPDPIMGMNTFWLPGEFGVGDWALTANGAPKLARIGKQTSNLKQESIKFFHIYFYSFTRSAVCLEIKTNRT